MDCKEQLKMKFEHGQPKNTNQKPHETEKEAVPKLKLNNNLMMALAALDNALKFSTEMDSVDSETQDFP